MKAISIHLVSSRWQNTCALVGCLLIMILYVLPGFDTRIAIDAAIKYVQYAGLPMA